MRSKFGEISQNEFQRYQDDFKRLRCEGMGIDTGVLSSGYSFDEVHKFQRILADYQIVICIQVLK